MQNYHSNYFGIALWKGVVENFWILQFLSLVGRGCSFRTMAWKWCIQIFFAKADNSYWSFVMVYMSFSRIGLDQFHFGIAGSGAGDHSSFELSGCKDPCSRRQGGFSSFEGISKILLVFILYGFKWGGTPDSSDNNCSEMSSKVTFLGWILCIRDWLVHKGNCLQIRIAHVMCSKVDFSIGLFSGVVCLLQLENYWDASRQLCLEDSYSGVNNLPSMPFRWIWKEMIGHMMRPR